jgi:prepilin-type N-terminal cleavage/methylation domain-containing protein
MKRSQRGFSLIELMMVLVVLTIVMGVIFKQIISVQQRYKTEAVRTDIFAEAREFMDQFGRDIHQSAYPTTKMYASGVLPTPMDQSANVGVGIVKASPTDLWMEGDVDGDGVIDSIRYTLQANGGMCPCTLSRSQVPKVAGAPTAQGFNYQTEVQGVVNSPGMGGGGGSLVIQGQSAVRQANGTSVVANDDTTFANLKTEPIFQYFDGNGNNVNVSPAVDVSTVAGQAIIMQIRSVRITMNVISTAPDPQTGIKQFVSLTQTAKLPNCSIYANGANPPVTGC